MGINDPCKLEEALSKIAPRAYSGKLPNGVSPKVVLYDMNALQMAAFVSTSNRSARDYVNALGRPTIRFAMADVAPPNPVLTPAPPMTTEEIAQLRQTQPDFFDVSTVASHATLVYCRDDGRYMPRNRELLHEDRYLGRATLTHEEVARGGYHVVDDRPLPGCTLSLDLKEDASSIRSRAAITSSIKRAYQTYGTHALCQVIGEAMQGMSPEMMAASVHRRRVLVDSTLAHFPMSTYRSTPLVDLEKTDWDKGERVVRCFSLSTDEHEGTLPPPALGEADLKMIWYASSLAKRGDDVLVCSSDSDLIFLFLLHAERFTRRGVRVFIDANTYNMKPERFTRRFIHVNELHRALERYSGGKEDASATLVLLALFCGSDYTDHPYRVGTTTIVDYFFNSDAGMRLLSNEGVSLLNVDWDEEGEENDAADGLRKLQLYAINVEEALEFMRGLYQCRITKATLKRFHVPDGKDLSWAEIGRLLAVQAEGKKDAARLEMPPMAEILAEIRRVQWVLHYWGNAHVAHGPFPLCELEDPDTHASIWGWSLVPESKTQGVGSERRPTTTRPSEYITAASNGSKLVVTRALSVVAPQEAHAWLLTEWFARASSPTTMLRFRMPYWNKHNH